MDFFTSDSHFGHKNIISYCNRPFLDVDDMTVQLTKRWNSVVGPYDTVYHLGDFAMGQKHLWPNYRKHLKGRIVLIRGNHDAPLDKIEAALLPGDKLCDEFLYESSHYSIHLAHVPDGYEDGRGYERAKDLEPGADLKFCGHVHDAYLVAPNGTINVGMDMWDYIPRTLDDILERISIRHD